MRQIEGLHNVHRCRHDITPSWNRATDTDAVHYRPLTYIGAMHVMQHKAHKIHFAYRPVQLAQETSNGRYFCIMQTCQ